MTIGGGPISIPAAVKPVTFVKDEKCMALWTDGKFYTAQVMKVDGPGKYTVKYLEYGNSKSLTAKEMKKAEVVDTTNKGGKAPQGKPAAQAKAK